MHLFQIMEKWQVRILKVAVCFFLAAWYQQPDGSFTEQIIDNAFTGARAQALADYTNDNGGNGSGLTDSLNTRLSLIHTAGKVVGL